MARTLLAPLALAAALAAAAPAAAATTTPAGTLLDPVAFTLRSATAAPRSCDRTRAPRRTRRGIAGGAFTPRIGGYLTVRAAGSDRSDWDIALYDARSRQLIAASQGFGSHEVVQAWVQPGRKLRIVGCRRSGRDTRLRLRRQLLIADAPGAGAPAALVRVSGLDRAAFERLEALGVDVTHKVGDGRADVIAGAGDLARLTKAGFAYEVRIADLDAYEARARRADARRAGTRSALPSGRSSYRTYEDIQAELKSLAEKNPDFVRPIKLPGASFQGRELSGLEIANGVGADDGRPQFLLVALHHAREWPAAEAAMEFANLLVQGRGRDARIDRILNSTRTVIVPLINPDGYISSRTTSLVDPSHNLYENGFDPPVPVCGNLNTCEGVAPPGGILSFRRKNCDGAIPSGAIPCELQYGVDPNRNYGQYWGGAGSSPDPMSQSYRGTGPWSEPETQAVHEWSQAHNVTTIITLHNVAALVLRPPGTKEDGLAPDEAELKRVGDAMAAATGYKSQYSYQLYDTSGTTEDWNYAAAGSFGYTIEMGPPDGEFHMPYETGVVGEWEGTGDHAGRGMREALQIAAEDAADPAHHSIVAGRAPAGRTLRLHKDFTTATKETCALAVTGAPFNTGAEVCAGGTIPAQQVPDKLDYTTVVPASGFFDWHVTPSTRPFAAKKGQTESWTLTCEDAGKVIESRQLTIARGERTDIDVPCGGILPSRPAVSVPAPGSKTATAGKSKVSLKKLRAKARKVCRKARKAKGGKRKRTLTKRCKAAKRKVARRKAATRKRR